jgi:hypothetical protein
MVTDKNQKGSRSSEPGPLSFVGDSGVRASTGFATEPLSLGGVLDLSLKICRTHFWKFFGIVFIPWMIVVLLWHAPWLFTRVFVHLSSILILNGLWILALAIMFLGFGALTYAVSCAYLGQEVSVSKSYLFLLKLAVRFFVTLAMCGLVVVALVGLTIWVGGFITSRFSDSPYEIWVAVVFWPFLLLVPWYAIPKLLLVDKVVVIENVAYFTAIRRSWSLLSGKADRSWPKGYRDRLVMILIIMFMLLFGCYVIATTFGTLMLGLSLIHEPQSIFILVSILSVFGFTCISVFAAVCLVVLYYDVRNRKEGLDIELLAQNQERAE